MHTHIVKHNLAHSKQLVSNRTIVSGSERKLLKGSGYYLDITVILLVNSILPLFGMPFVCATTLRSITHANRFDLNVCFKHFDLNKLMSLSLVTR